MKMERVVICFFLSICCVYAVLEDPVVYRIEEDMPAKTWVGDLKADANLAEIYGETQLKRLRFVFLGQGSVANDYITVEENTGIVETSQILDRDTICPELEDCEIQVDIAVQPTEFFNVIKLVLIIEDINDHAPVFTPNNVTYSLSEATQPGELFMVIPAQDPDSPTNGISYYDLVSPITDQFRLNIKKRFDGTLDLMSLNLMTPLDYERQDLYILKVIAVDGGTPAKSGTMTVRINVLDVNDNNPVFDNETYEIWVDENSLGELCTVHATDPDTNHNGRVEYSFAPRTTLMHGDLFQIDTVTGQISLKQALDHEKEDSYSLTVTAKDQGQDSFPVSAKVIINVNDLNDNEPVVILDDSLLDDSGAFQVLELADKDTFVAHFSVEDKDGGANGKVECELSNEYFLLVKMYEYEYKLVTKAMLDREVVEDYTLHLKCYDLGEVPHVTLFNVNIKVLDVNDHSPVFIKQEYESTLSENNMIDAFIDRVSASDQDAGLNGKIRYELHKDAGNAFKVDPKSGMLRAAVSFDREQNSQLVFHVLAIDHGTPALTSTSTVILHIEDRDDQAPVFTKHKYTFKVLENQPGPLKIGTVNATDYDLPPNNDFTFFLDADPNILDKFTIDVNTGEMYTKKQLDREDKPLYRITVMVQSKDYAPMSDQCLVEVQILDKNDNSPTIIFPEPQNNTIYISALIPVDHVVAKVQAFDPDDGENGTLTYSLSEGNERQEFSINKDTGEVLMQSAVDVLIETDDKSRLFPLAIMVSDQGTPPQITMETLNIVVDQTIPLDAALDGDDPLSVLQDSQLGIIIAACCGLVLVLAIILIVVFIRNHRRRKREQGVGANTGKEFWDIKEQTTNAAPPGGTMSNEEEEEDDQEEEDDVKIRPASSTSSDLYIGKSVGPDTLAKPGDSDSGCADVSHTDSQSSGEENKPQQSPPLPPPPPEAASKFSDWVHNESFQLRRSGNMYRVSNNNMQRKMVRFDDERSTPSPPPPPILSKRQNDYTHEPAMRSNSPVIVGNSTHPLVVYPKTKSGHVTSPSHPAHPRVQFSNTLPLARSSTPPVQNPQQQRPSTPLGMTSGAGSRSTPSIEDPQNSRIQYADISNVNKSSHYGNRSVVVPITPNVGVHKPGVTLQGWTGPSHCGDNDGSLV